ncbi:hypothetical protein E3H11_04365 [Bradyrhizobium brasilense]|uniref:hypothetical protein n=1 Tax=Bradyrhizobium brasilense TaxID=1419277 RepID=UPI0014573A27|nr:hypothetical protein [Bradyrhizobium brasilense]NLS68167.1 hypothetical protein [Bradyrhizobium brasilense]
MTRAIVSMMRSVEVSFGFASVASATCMVCKVIFCGVSSPISNARLSAILASNEPAAVFAAQRLRVKHLRQLVEPFKFERDGPHAVTAVERVDQFVEHAIHVANRAIQLPGNRPRRIACDPRLQDLIVPLLVVDEGKLGHCPPPLLLARLRSLALSRARQ